jgi:GxxExxY protein
VHGAFLKGEIREEESAVSMHDLTARIIGACIEVHRELGPGLLESAYEECLCYELEHRGIQFARQQPLPVVYKGQRLDCAYVLDVVVEKSVILELKSVEKLLPIHEAQIITYLKLANLSLGLLINFNVYLLKSGIRRIANNYKE